MQGLCTLLSRFTLEGYRLSHLNTIDLIIHLIYMQPEWVLGRSRAGTAGFNNTCISVSVLCCRSVWTYIGLSLFISSVFIYVCIKKLTIYRRTGLYPWLHPRWCRRRFFLLLFFFRLFAPRCRSLLGLVVLTSHPLPSPISRHCLFPAAPTTSRLHSPPLSSDGCCDCTTNSLALSSLLSTTIGYLDWHTASWWEMFWP